VCSGWAGVHDTEHLLGLRLALTRGDMSAETFRAIVKYRSPIPLFASGTAAYEHGIRDIDNPSTAARAAIMKIEQVRDDLIDLDDQPSTTKQRSRKPSPAPPARRRTGKTAS
jgi:hypothetical protein